jgi:branched-subunit amino acid ABC-type transport system permease component
VQYGLLLFLVASGLTLIFGIMGVINLAHGSFYMIGAYMAFALAPLWRQHFGGGFFATLAGGPAAGGAWATCWNGPSSATCTSVSTCSRC